MRRFPIICFLITASFGLAACGGSDSSGPPCPAAAETRSAVAGKVTVCAYDIRYDVETIEATAGAVEITLVNKGAISHNFSITGEDFLLSTPGRGDSESGTITLEAGTYEFVCTISGHAQAGMKGKLVVS